MYKKYLIFSKCFDDVFLVVGFAAKMFHQWTLVSYTCTCILKRPTDLILCYSCIDLLTDNISWHWTKKHWCKYNVYVYRLNMIWVVFSGLTPCSWRSLQCICFVQCTFSAVLFSCDSRELRDSIFLYQWD